MVGRADMLFANRTLSAMIVVSLMVSAFAGLLLAVGVPQVKAASGNLVVTGTYTIEDIVQPVDGNVYVSAGGNLIIRNATLSVISNSDPAQRHTITVNSSGTLTLDHGTITTYLDQIDPWPFLTLNVNGGTVVASGASVLQFPGSMTLSGSASVTLSDTTVTGLPSGLVSDFVVGMGGSIILDQADDGPAISLTDLAWLRLYDSSILKLPEYGTAGIPAVNMTLTSNSNLLAVNSYIGADFGPVLNAGGWYTHNVISLSGFARAYLYGCTFETYLGDNGDREPAIVTALPGSGAYVYRWLNASVGDEYGVPIIGATISAKFTGVTEFEGMTAFYYTYTGVLTTPPAEVLSYLGETTLTYQTTKSDGRAVIPYLTDIIINGENPLYVGTYAFTGSKTIGGTPYSSIESFSLKAYPAMEAGDVSSGFTVKLMGVSVQSPDPARWLVVPPDLLIEGMTYYHAGDTIVAAGGTLSFVDAGFQLVQESANQRSIIVDGTQASPAILEFQNTIVTSDRAINLIVQGHGVVEAWNTEFQGVNIIALENSQVIFHNVTMNGNITTAWDSNAQINVYDSVLMQSITLSGNSVGGFTNTSVPSVVVEDAAIGNIYRWIHVTVFDGAGYPCPGAAVTARYFINGTDATTGVSGSDGIARVNSIGTVITAGGSIFMGNYRVNASLTVHGQTYYADNEISVGVWPYTEPLGQNATFAIMNIPDALPDLTSVVVTVDPASPRNHAQTYLNATVFNTGAVPAHDVTADFYDVTEYGTVAIGTGVVDFIPVDGSGVITLMWTAQAPLSPKTHSISAIVDPLNLVNELDETPVSGSIVIAVQNLPDVLVRSEVTEITTVPQDIIVNTAVQLSVNVHNEGDATTGDVIVDFYDTPLGQARTSIGSATVTGIPWNDLRIASVTWIPAFAGTHTVEVLVNGGNTGAHSFDEISFTNNEASRVFTVLTPPNLVLSNIQFNPAGSVPGGDLLTISATLRNNQLAPVTFTNVALYVGDTLGASVSDYDVTDRLSDNNAVTVSFSYPTPIVTTSTVMTFFIVVNPSQADPAELTYSDNTVSGSITVLDMRSDLVITPSNINVYSGTQDITSSMFGKKVKVVVNVTNVGGRAAYDFTVSVGIRNESFVGGGSYNTTLKAENLNVSSLPDVNVVSMTFDWTVMLTVWADYEIWVYVDSWVSGTSIGNVSEPIETNNWAVLPFTIVQLTADVRIVLEKTEFTSGDEIYITMTISYAGTGTAVPDVPNVYFQLVDASTRAPVEGSQTAEVKSSADGFAIQTLTIPISIDSGSYEVVAVIFGTTYADTAPAVVQISSGVSGELFPWWVWILIIVIVGAVIAGFTVYTYFYGLGKYVECGECGAFIPAASKRCPKCGVEFEAGTMKCSECGAWIPAESTECPNCGVKFVGETEEQADYMERMRKEYDDMVSKYRELAKPELGKKFSDKAFDEWWRKQAGYISFDDWLAKEEEKKKEGPIPCPVCGTLNPKEATVCHKCGTVFGGRGGPGGKGPPSVQASVPQEEQPPENQQSTTQASVAPGAAPRMVIRRPIEKKVVPKKIIRTPSGQIIEEEQKEDNNQQ
jgi:ribosomal protein L40E